MRYNQEKLSHEGITFSRLYACGGGAKSAPWLQIKADILGCEIIRIPSEETGAMGSAILGFAATQKKPILQVAESFLHYGESYLPNPENKAIYDQKYALYSWLRECYT